jgi:hypothetical protein
MQIQSKSLEQFQETVLTVIIEQLNSQNDGFQTSLIFTDYNLKYGLKIYNSINECTSDDELNNIDAIIIEYESQMVEKYSNGLFVDFKYLNFGYDEFLEWLDNFKSNFWFRSNGYIFNYAILNDETIDEEYIKIIIEKSRLIL